MSFDLADYVDVAERIREFYEKYPEGSLQSGGDPRVLEIGGQPFIAYHALAFRGPEDEKPSHGWAWEPVPGPTQFTKDSELMNAETAAWGRAIVALGFATKKTASAQEVRNRSGNEPTQTTAAAQRAQETQPANGNSDGSWAWPFGKWKGHTLNDTPIDYMDWFLENSDKEDIKERIRAFRGEIPISAYSDEDVPFLPSIDGIGG